jgi:glutathione S-transferase
VAISPFKKVPLLQVDDEVIFDSIAINEYIEDAYPQKLHPSDLILRAKNRAWIEASNDCLWCVFNLSVKELESDFISIRDDIWNKFDLIEHAIIGAPFFDGDMFSLVDASFAPLFQRLDYVDELKPGVYDRQRHPKICAWKVALLQHPAVKKSSLPNLRELYRELIWKRRGYVSKFLDRSQYDANVQKSIY